uniref:LSM domain-containing protein n=1 Tax=Chromera velia CCMP2878 TaxID=1169474 RepID=A0A0G4FCS6_9ALVE|eukprot:Cvel_16280.t1-p1 / transcript=Cvel_16280.t1 / gene=Cvel_16280 / organism=Chromera_velia_CCMP2878 / gene_product=hypothetical protein / transcript_product=hypothetical protein / location=Cvel_scaffold1246:43174-46696(+) / protein_length=496 / sequence_SO=supercontig / SO=protein_coding / is_pseudo=false
MISKKADYDERLDFRSRLFDPLLALQSEDVVPPDPLVAPLDDIGKLAFLLPFEVQPKLCNTGAEHKASTRRAEDDYRREAEKAKTRTLQDRAHRTAKKIVSKFQGSNTKGPFAFLKRCVREGQAVRVRVRTQGAFVSFVYGVPVLFDSHCNLVLRNVTRVNFSLVKTKSGRQSPSAAEAEREKGDSRDCRVGEGHRVGRVERERGDVGFSQESLGEGGEPRDMHTASRRPLQVRHPTKAHNSLPGNGTGGIGEVWGSHVLQRQRLGLTREESMTAVHGNLLDGTLEELTEESESEEGEVKSLEESEEAMSDPVGIRGEGEKEEVDQSLEAVEESRGERTCSADSRSREKGGGEIPVEMQKEEVGMESFFVRGDTVIAVDSSLSLSSGKQRCWYWSNGCPAWFDSVPLSSETHHQTLIQAAGPTLGQQHAQKSDKQGSRVHGGTSEGPADGWQGTVQDGLHGDKGSTGSLGLTMWKEQRGPGDPVLFVCREKHARGL